MKAAVLVGGRGTRLGLVDKPKPMVDFLGKPLLHRIVDNLVQQNVKEIIFLSGYLAHVIEDYFGDGSEFGAQITHVVEDMPLGTAGAFRTQRELFTEPFLVLYGDVLFDIDLDRFCEYSQKKGGLGTLFVHPNDHPYDSDLVEVNADLRIVKVHPKPHNIARVSNLVNAAIYYLDPQIIDFVEEGVCVDWGREVFPKIVNAGGEIFAYRSTEYVKDVGTPDRIAKAQKSYQSGEIMRRNYKEKQKAIFLDRDGVINTEIDGVYSPEGFELREGVGEAIKKINESGYLAIVVTNQPGLAKGFMSFETLEEVHKEMETCLAKKGALLDDIFFCPHHPETGFAGEVPALKRPCDCRKPGSGLLVQASQRHNISFEQSFMIGDRTSDLMAADKVGVKGIFMRGTEEPKGPCTPFAEVNSLLEAVTLICGTE